MTTTASTPNPAAARRMTPDDFIVTTIAQVFAAESPANYYAYFAGFFAEAIRLIHAAHLTDCTAGPNRYCDTCDAIRAAQVGLLAEQRTATTAGEEVSGSDPH